MSKKGKRVDAELLAVCKEVADLAHDAVLERNSSPVVLNTIQSKLRKAIKQAEDKLGKGK